MDKFKKGFKALKGIGKKGKKGKGKDSSDTQSIASSQSVGLAGAGPSGEGQSRDPPRSTSGTSVRSGQHQGNLPTHSASSSTSKWTQG